MILPISHYLPHINRRSFLRAIVLSIIAVLVICVSSFAQDKSAAKKLTSPDVLVLVLSGMGPYDQVSINYTSAVSKLDAQRDLDTLARKTAWNIQNQSISTQAGSMPGAKSTTSATFQVLPVVNASQGVLPLEPFIVVLKRFKTIQINYLVASSFTFQGLKNFEDDFVKINLSRSGNSYLYTVGVKNSNFDRLNLPLKEESKAPQKASMPVGARVLLIIGLALICALLVYGVVTVLTKGRGRR